MLSSLRARLPAGVQPYLSRPAVASFAFGIASGFPYALLAAQLTQWLSESGIDRKSVGLFSWVLFTYNLKVLWAPMVDKLKLPVLHRLGQRRSWLIFSSLLLTLAVWHLAMCDPKADLKLFAIAAIVVGICGATLDIVIDAFRIELMQGEAQGAGAALSQYGWRTGALLTANIVLGVAAGFGWSSGYLAASSVVLFAVIAGLWIGEPKSVTPRSVVDRRPGDWLRQSLIAPFVEFFSRQGAWLVLLFVLLHKIGDTLANLMLRNLLVTLEFTKGEIQWADVNFGTLSLMIGIFVGGICYARLGIRWSVMLSLLLMMLSNLSFAALAHSGHSVIGLAATMGFENFASGVGGVAVVGYLSSLCHLNFTATQFALLSAASSILGRFLTGAFAGSLIDSYGYVNFYLLSTLAALPGVLLFVALWRLGLVKENTHANKPRDDSGRAS